MATSLCNARVKKLSYQNENKLCTDCNNPHSQWVSINIGCFLCLRCAGVHRSIGVHITKIKSITLDNWTTSQYNFLRQHGNTKVNAIYEAALPSGIKPTSTSTDTYLKKFIEDKYVNRLFYRAPPKPKPPPSPPKIKEELLIDLSNDERNDSGFNFIN